MRRYLPNKAPRSCNLSSRPSRFLLFGDSNLRLMVRKINEAVFSKVTSGIDTRMNVTFVFGNKSSQIFFIESAYFGQAPLSNHFDQPLVGELVRLHWSNLKFFLNPAGLEAKLKFRQTR